MIRTKDIVRLAQAGHVCNAAAYELAKSAGMADGEITELLDSTSKRNPMLSIGGYFADILIVGAYVTMHLENSTADDPNYGTIEDIEGRIDEIIQVTFAGAI